MLRKSVLIAMLFVLLGSFSGEAVAAIVRNLSPAEAYQMLQQRKEELFLLDVRTPGEYFQVRLAGAKLIPIGQLLRRMGEVPRNRPILVYCEIGSRSSQVVNHFGRNGFPEVYNLYGGINAWRKSYPVLVGPP